MVFKAILVAHMAEGLPAFVFHYAQRDRRVVLPSYDIRRRNAPLSPKLVKMSDLYAAIDDLIQTTPFTALVSVINLRSLKGALSTATLPFKDHLSVVK